MVQVPLSSAVRLTRYVLTTLFLVPHWVEVHAAEFGNR